MNDKKAETQPTPGVPTTRRGLAYSAIVGLAHDLFIARFALTRALDKLPTEDLMQVLDEVGETVDAHHKAGTLRIVTPRDEK